MDALKRINNSELLKSNFVIEHDINKEYLNKSNLDTQKGIQSKKRDIKFNKSPIIDQIGAKYSDLIKKGSCTPEPKLRDNYSFTLNLPYNQSNSDYANSQPNHLHSNANNFTIFPTMN